MLNSRKIGDRKASSSQGPRKNVGSGYRVLNCQINAHTTDRRHGVSRIANAQESRAIPLAQTVNLDCQQPDLIPALQFSYTVAQERHNRYNVGSESFESFSLDPVEFTLTNQVCALPVVVTVEHHYHLALTDASQGLLAIFRSPEYAKPQHIHGRAELIDLKSGLLSHNRIAPTAPDTQIRANV